MSNPIAAAFGSWNSPISSDMIVARSIRLGQTAVDSDEIYWLEERPSEEGRSVVVRRSTKGEISDITPQPYNVRTRVHEYGGGAFMVHQGIVYFSNFSDQRLYRQKTGYIPIPVTPAGNLRFADGVFDSVRNSLVCVCEDHSGSEVKNSLVRVDAGGAGVIRSLVSGCDFYASPRLSPDGAHLVWISWNHPDMPWDSSQLWLGEIGPDGSVNNPQQIAGGPNESVCQPEFSPDGSLFFVSDRSGWWNLFSWKNGRVEAVYPLEAEFAVPHWVFAQSRYAFASARQIVFSYIQNGVSFLGSLDLTSRQMKKIESPYTWTDNLRMSAGKVIMTAGSPLRHNAVVVLDLSTGKEEVLRASSTVKLDPGYISSPLAIEFPTEKGTTDHASTEKGATAHAFYYPPANRDYAGLPGELPPLLVFSHGGPTSAANNVLNLTLQYFTSRGWAVANVNYGGSSGFGRIYRQRLNGQWGIVDVDDCVNCVRYLVGKGLVDPARLAIRGGSAGGYTTLCALTFRNIFKAGASYYGVSDVEADARDTHKFESHYEDILIGPYPARRDLYLERSPINFVDRLSSPVIFFQGMEDKIVLPVQSEKMVEALRRKGIPVAYLLFEHEQHGFNIAANIKRSLEAELYFYSKVLGFELADPVAPVEIENFK